MRTVAGVVMVAGALCVSACANQSGAMQQSSAVPESGGEQTSAVDPNAIEPERQDAIERAFQRKIVELQECWSNEYEKTHDRKLEGDLTIAMDIKPSGETANVRVLKSTINNHDIESCVVTQASGWSFSEGKATVPYMRTVHLGAQF